jgi:hypothetical protein
MKFSSVSARLATETVVLTHRKMVKEIELLVAMALMSTLLFFQGPVS